MLINTQELKLIVKKVRKLSPRNMLEISVWFVEFLRQKEREKGRREGRKKRRGKKQRFKWLYNSPHSHE